MGEAFKHRLEGECVVYGSGFKGPKLRFWFGKAVCMACRGSVRRVRAGIKEQSRTRSVAVGEGKGEDGDG